MSDEQQTFKVLRRQVSVLQLDRELQEKFHSFSTNFFYRRPEVVGYIESRGWIYKDFVKAMVCEVGCSTDIFRND